MDRKLDEKSFCEWGKSPIRTREHGFLEGPKSRQSELITAFKVFFEFLKGFRALHFVGPCVTVFGSARFAEDHPYYQLGVEIGSELANLGFSVMTGGGPGIMEAANRGAKNSGGVSLGCNIRLPKEQTPNQFLDRWVEFNYFFVRKVMLVKYSYAFIALPGGYGTMDEIFETATLIQTGKILDFPLVLIGKEFWSPLLDFIRDKFVGGHTIDGRDLDILHLTDSPQEAAKFIYESAARRFGVKRTEKRKPLWWLFEKDEL